MLDVVYEDNQLLVVIKPHNIPTQEDNSKDEDLLSMCKKYIKEKYNKPGEVYLGMVQRLDRPTGGLICFARTSKAANRLCEAIKNGDFKKTYLTVVCGCPKEKSGTITNYLKKDTKNNIVRIVPSSEEGAKFAQLDYEVLDSRNTDSLIKVNLETGRSHQIRVQMHSLKTSIYGDKKYGAPNSSKKLALWAYRLEFEHPTNGKTMQFVCLPELEESPWKFYDKTINNLAFITETMNNRINLDDNIDLE